MTTLPILSRSGSLETGAPSSPSAGSGAVIAFREFSAARPMPLARTRDLAALISSYEANPERAALMASARQALVVEAYADREPTLAVFRLQAGMSQTQLAEKVGTSQSHIARIELGQNDPGTDIVVRIAEALRIDAAKAFAGIRAHRNTEGEDK